MAIAKCERMSKGTHVSKLPGSWGKLYQITAMKDHEFVASRRGRGIP